MTSRQIAELLASASRSEGRSGLLFGYDLETLQVLADALLETSTPALGEDLALVLAGRHFFPANGRARGGRFARPEDQARALRIVLRRIHRAHAWSKQDADDRERGLRELDNVARGWTALSAQDREGELTDTVAQLEGREGGELLSERLAWLFKGQFGRGAQILAEEVADRVISYDFRLRALLGFVLAFDDRLPFSATDAVWNRLGPQARRRVASAVRDTLAREGIVERPTARRR